MPATFRLKSSFRAGGERTASTASADRRTPLARTNVIPTEVEGSAVALRTIDGKSSFRAGCEAAEEPRLVELLRGNRAHFEFDIESLRALPVQSDFLAVRRKRTSRDEHVIESRLQVQ